MEYKKIESFKDLIVWQKGIEIVNDIYTATKKFPKDELYCLTSQIRRSAISIQQTLQKAGDEVQQKITSSFWKYHEDLCLNSIH